MYSFAYFLALLGSCLFKEAWAQQEVVFDCAQMPGMKQSLALLNFNYFSVNSTLIVQLLFKFLVLYFTGILQVLTGLLGYLK